jgi:hypothetical protein
VVLSHSLPVCPTTANRIQKIFIGAEDNVKYDQLITRLDIPHVNSAFAINFITPIRRLKKGEVDLHIHKS